MIHQVPGLELCPDHLDPGAEQLQPRPNTRGVKKAEQRNILEDQETGQVVITTRLLSAGIVHFSKIFSKLTENGIPWGCTNPFCPADPEVEHIYYTWSS